MSLYDEEPVVGKRTVPKECVRMTKDTVVDEKEVSEEVRMEQGEAEGDAVSGAVWHVWRMPVSKPCGRSSPPSATTAPY